MDLDGRALFVSVVGSVVAIIIFTAGVWVLMAGRGIGYISV